MLTRDDIKRLVAAYTPIMYMHPADKFMPCSAEWFMERSCLEGAVPVVNGEVAVLSCSTVSRQQTLHHLPRVASSARYCMSIDKRHDFGQQDGPAGTVLLAK